MMYSVLLEGKDFRFSDQIQRAVMSMMDNIAEGVDGRSNNEFRHSLYNAKGSCGEVRTRLIIAQELE